MEPRETKKAANAMVVAMTALKTAFDELGKKMIEIGRTIDQAFWAAYEEAGEPYGPNYAGRDRWLREMGEAQRCQERSEQIILQHQMYAEMRRLFKGRIR